MTTDDEIRARIASAGKPRARKTKQERVEPTWRDLAAGSVLAFDQTLTNAGWTYLARPEEGRVYAIFSGVCRPEKHEYLRGHPLTFARARDIHHQMLDVLERFGDRVDAIVYEMPAVHGMRLESSLMAARELLSCVEQLHLATPVVGVYNQHMKAALIPPEVRSANKKADVRAAVLGLVDVGNLIAQRPPNPLNEHVYDAIALGLTYLYDQKSDEVAA